MGFRVVVFVVEVGVLIVVGDFEGIVVLVVDFVEMVFG